MFKLTGYDMVMQSINFLIAIVYLCLFLNMDISVTILQLALHLLCVVSNLACYEILPDIIARIRSCFEESTWWSEDYKLFAKWVRFFI